MEAKGEKSLPVAAICTYRFLTSTEARGFSTYVCSNT